MADTVLLNTNLYALPLEQSSTTAAGVVTKVPMPLTVQLNVAASSPALAAHIGPSPDGTTQWLFFNAAVAESDSTNGGGGITLTVSDTANPNDTSDPVGSFSISGAPPTAGITNEPLAASLQVVGQQAIPTAPGP